MNMVLHFSLFSNQNMGKQRGYKRMWKLVQIINPALPYFTQYESQFPCEWRYILIHVSHLSPNKET